MTPDRVIVVDWSSASKPAKGANSIWLGFAGQGARLPENITTRQAAEMRLRMEIKAALKAGERLLIGVDFAFGYPAGFAERLTGEASAPAVWRWLAEHIHDAPTNDTNNKAVAALANRKLGDTGPFWGNGEKIDYKGLSRKKAALPEGLSEHREIEEAARALGHHPKSVWQLAGAGSVGAQSLTGLPMIARLRKTYADDVAIWPFEPWDEAQIIIAEVYPSILTDEVTAAQADHPIKDAAQVHALADWLHGHPNLTALLNAPPPGPARLEEGWILGIPRPKPKLKNDCFALPPGVDWVPVDEAQARLQAILPTVAETETLALADADTRVLAAPLTALRSNPPAPNAAVDGYGFAAKSLEGGLTALPLAKGRAAAGAPFDKTLPKGRALRILTGAILPKGVDTVVLEEDVTVEGNRVSIPEGLKPGANTRRAGEDVEEGAEIFPKGHILTPPDIALATALGISIVEVYSPLRVGVLSTGDELVTPGETATGLHQIYDANRPMLMAMLKRWGAEVIDLGQARDESADVRARLSKGAAEADLILTSGGASAGDEDHVSRLLRDEGSLASWRIALKPGRPLALATWEGVPVLGLPGNPVAAFVCTLIFGYPAVRAMSGAGWSLPRPTTVPAAFAKAKKAGRREFLRARLNAAGAAEPFKSEGSGRISGLSWATGLLELDDPAQDIVPGTLLRFYPYVTFGL